MTAPLGAAPALAAAEADVAAADGDEEVDVALESDVPESDVLDPEVPEPSAPDVVEDDRTVSSVDNTDVDPAELVAVDEDADEDAPPAEIAEDAAEVGADWVPPQPDTPIRQTTKAMPAMRLFPRKFHRTHL